MFLVMVRDVILMTFLDSLRVLRVHFLDLMRVVQTSKSNQYIHKLKVN